MNAMAELAGSFGPTNDPFQASIITREAMQEIILYAIDKAGFSDNVIFHGGTCLRILHGLDRFSEDLDFNLRETDSDLDTNSMVSAISEELEAVGLENYTKIRPGVGVKPVFSAKFNTNLKNALITAGFNEKITKMAHSRKNLTVKLDIDMRPPKQIKDVVVEKKGPLEYQVRAEPLPILFAGKTAAVLCRQWKDRIKGRDFYDFRWYVQNKIPLDMDYLRSNLDLKCTQDVEITPESLVQLLDQRFDSIDWTDAKMDLLSFVKFEQIGSWIPESFKKLAREIVFEKY